MKLIINSLFIDPDVILNVSTNVIGLICGKLEGVLKPSEIFNEEFEGFDLGFTISSKKGIPSVSVQGPLIDKEEQEIYFTIWMPYEKINSSNDYLESYLDNLLKGIQLGLEKYKIKRNALIEQFEEAKKEILENSDVYTYRRGSLDIDEMLNDIEIFEEE